MTTATALLPTTARRRTAMLRTAMGSAIAAALADDAVVEVMANPDGKLWLDRHGEGRIDSGVLLTPAEAERIIRLVASHIGFECHDRAPIVSAELPETRERFEGVLPPVSAAPCFSIRKPAKLVYRLADYVAAGILTRDHAGLLKQAVLDRSNIIIAGGTGSGKTTLANALLAEIAETGDRVLILEDTRELACAAKDRIELKTKPGVADLKTLVRSTMRLRPDRIIVGEVRGGEALDLLKSWNTGHPGGLTTLHANSAMGALHRLEQLIEEVVTVAPRRMIAEAVNLIVFIEGRGATRRVTATASVAGLDPDGGYRLADPLTPPNESLCA